MFVDNAELGSSALVASAAPACLAAVILVVCDVPAVLALLLDAYYAYVAVVASVVIAGPVGGPNEPGNVGYRALPSALRLTSGDVGNLTG